MFRHNVKSVLLHLGFPAGLQYVTIPNDQTGANRRDLTVGCLQSFPS